MIMNVMAYYVFFMHSCLADQKWEMCVSLHSSLKVFNVSELENFMKEARLGECRLSYAVVSIMGPQSSGM